jgi:multidrug efflux pump subunit AcrB
LVDEATVEIENIHTQLRRTGSVALAVWRGNQQTAVPRLLALLCMLAVFLPTFFMQGLRVSCLPQLALAVIFAMAGSYLLSSTLVQVLCVCGCCVPGMLPRVVLQVSVVVCWRVCCGRWLVV